MTNVFWPKQIIQLLMQYPAYREGGIEANCKLRSTREAKGLTQTAAAKLCNVALRTFQDWKNGRNSNPLGAIDKMRDLGDEQS
jgi:DNA-binding XRE family transcriptional regulator